MNEKQILFNTPMVRAILEGRKTQTRRIIRPHYHDGDAGFNVVTNAATGQFCYIEYYDEEERSTGRRLDPAYRPGDTLWVRETFGYDCYAAWNKRVYYKADYPDGKCQYVVRPGYKSGWLPSIHMPKEAARIFLRVEDVRAEKLQRIDKEGIEAEGIILHHTQETARQAFAGLWDSTIAPEKLATEGWAANPWVWVYTFQRVEKPEGWGAA